MHCKDCFSPPLCLYLRSKLPFCGLHWTALHCHSTAVYSCAPSLGGFGWLKHWYSSDRYISFSKTPLCSSSCIFFYFLSLRRLSLLLLSSPGSSWMTENLLSFQGLLLLLTLPPAPWLPPSSKPPAPCPLSSSSLAETLWGFWLRDCWERSTLNSWNNYGIRSG